MDLMKQKSEVLATVKSLIVTRQEGMPTSSIDGEYSELNGDNIPFYRFGYHSLKDFILSEKSIIMKRNDWGENVYMVDPNDKRMGHINNFVQNQKKQKRKSPTPSLRNQRPYYNRRTNKRPYYSRQENYNSDGGSSGDEDGSVDYKHPTEIRIDPDMEVGTHVHGPLANGHQLIGDDFLLQMAIRKLGAPCWRKTNKSALHCGLCISGQTIKDCIERLKNIDTLSNRVVIMLGAVDVYKKVPYQQIKKDYTDLLMILHERFGYSNNQITLCTVPPLANLAYHTSVVEMTNLYALNSFIKRLGDEEFMGNEKFNVVDVYDEFTEDGCTIDYELFQYDARFVSGTSQPFVLFNVEGRQKLYDLFTNACNRIPSRSQSPLYYF